MYVSLETLRRAVRLLDSPAELDARHNQLAGIEPCHNLDRTEGTDLTNYLRAAENNTIAPVRTG